MNVLELLRRIEAIATATQPQLVLAHVLDAATYANGAANASVLQCKAGQWQLLYGRPLEALPIDGAAYVHSRPSDVPILLVTPADPARQHLVFSLGRVEDLPTIMLLTPAEPTFSADQIAQTRSIITSAISALQRLITLQVAQHSQATAEAALHASEIRYRQLVQHLPDRTLDLFAQDLRAIVVDDQALRALQRLRMLEAVVLNMSDGVIVVDARRQDRQRPLLFANHSFCQMTGYSEAELHNVTPELLKGPLTDSRLIFHLLQAAQRGEHDQIELICYRKDGSHFWAVIDIAPVIDAEGQLDYHVIVLHDISRRKQAETVLSDREALLRTIGDNLPDGMIYQSALLPDGTYHFRYVSAGVERISGFSAEQVLADPSLLYSIIAAEDQERVRQTEQETLRSLSTFDVDVRKQLANGEIRWSTIRSQPRRAEDGSIIFDGIEIDTTKRRRSEQALRDSEEKYRLLFEHSTDAILISDHTGRIMQVNDAACTLLGNPRDQLVTLHTADLLGPTLEHVLDYLTDTRGYQIGELDIRRPNGDIRITEYVVCRVTPRLYISMLRDITERKLAEAELRAAYDGLELRVQQRTIELVQLNQALEAEIRQRQNSEERYRTLVETSPSAILVTDLVGIIRFCNQRAATLFGYEQAEDLYGINGSNLVEASTAHHASVRMILEPQQSRNIEYTMVRKNGERFYAEASSSVVTSPDGLPTSLIIVVHDVSERKLAEEALTAAYHHVAALNRHLSDSRSLLQALFDGLEDGLLLLDQYGQIQVINRTLAALLDITPEQVLGQPWASVYHHAAPDFPGQLALELTTIGRQRSQQHRYYSPHDGTRILDIQVIALGEGDHIEQTILHVIDATDTIRLQEQVIRAEHFAASGRLAASVAHEINTPLQTIQTNLKLLQRALAPAYHPFIADALAEMHRVGRIVHQLLDFYRPAATKRGPVDLAALVERIVLLLGKRIRDQRVTITRHMTPDLPPVYGRADELTQIILNLVVNALDVMPHGGSLQLGVELSSDATQIVVMIGDSGPGIAPELHEQIFDPFVTTKSNGTGLGLSISKQIAEQHGGTIHVISDPGRGSVFVVTLPIGTIIESRPK